MTDWWIYNRMMREPLKFVGQPVYDHSHSVVRQALDKPVNDDEMGSFRNEAITVEDGDHPRSVLQTRVPETMGSPPAAARECVRRFRAAVRKANSLREERVSEDVVRFEDAFGPALAVAWEETE